MHSVWPAKDNSMSFINLSLNVTRISYTEQQNVWPSHRELKYLQYAFIYTGFIYSFSHFYWTAVGNARHIARKALYHWQAYHLICLKEWTTTLHCLHNDASTSVKVRNSICYASLLQLPGSLDYTLSRLSMINELKVITITHHIRQDS